MNGIEFQKYGLDDKIWNRIIPKPNETEGKYFAAHWFGWFEIEIEIFYLKSWLNKIAVKSIITYFKDHIK